MAFPAVPSKVLKSFIGLEESEVIVQSPPAVSKCQPQSRTVRQAVTMCRSNSDQLEERTSIFRSSPIMSKYQPRPQIGEAVTMDRPKANRSLPISQSAIDLNSSIIMPQQPSVGAGSRASFTSLLTISEDQHDEHTPPSVQGNNNCSDMALRRKGAMKRHCSSSRTSSEINTSMMRKDNYPLRRVKSDDILQIFSSPYNPNKPLMKDFPLKKLEISHLARVRSIKTTIGPLTKEVCEQLNIVVESEEQLTKVTPL